MIKTLKKLGSYFNMSIRKRMIITTVLIAIIPLIVLLSYLSVTMRRDFIDEEKDYYISKLNSVAKQIERNFQTYESSSMFVSLDQDLSYGLVKNFQNLSEDKATFYIRANKLLSTSSVFGGAYSIFFTNQTLFEYRNFAPIEKLTRKTTEKLELSNLFWQAEIVGEKDKSVLAFYHKIGVDSDNYSVLRLEIPFSILTEIVTNESEEDYRLEYLDSNEDIIILKNFSDASKTSSIKNNYLEYVLENQHKLVITYEDTGDFSKYFNNYVLIIILFSILIIVVGLLMMFTVKKTLRDFDGFINVINSNDLSDIYDEILGDDEVGIIKRRFLELLKNSEKLHEENISVLQKQRWLELRLVQSKINPHMLYNSLSVIKWQALMYDLADLSDLVDYLVQYYRSSLNEDSDVLTVREEIKLIKNYIGIIEFAYQTKYNFKHELDETLLDSYIPKLLLQPLVENAIMHGLNAIEGEKHVLISGNISKGRVILVVEDNGIGMKKEDIEKLADGTYISNTGGFGMKSVRERLNHCFFDTCEFTIESESEKFTRITLSFPETTRDEWLKQLGN